MNVPAWIRTIPTGGGGGSGISLAGGEAVASPEALGSSGGIAACDATPTRPQAVVDATSAIPTIHTHLSNRIRTYLCANRALQLSFSLSQLTPDTVAPAEFWWIPPGIRWIDPPGRVNLRCVGRVRRICTSVHLDGLRL